jgi:hypothetical protein
MPRAIEARGLPDAAPWARQCRPLSQQGHARDVTQEDKASLWPPRAQRLLGPHVSPWNKPPSPPRRL